MKNIFLTSSIHGVATTLINELDLTVGNKLIFINTATEAKEGDKSWEARDKQSLVDVGFNVTDYTITGKNKTELETFLKDFDYIYVSGGDKVYLLEQSIQSGFISVIKDLILVQGKTYIGTSAGSIITAEKFNDYVTGELRTGFGFINFNLVPHWGDEFFRSKYLDHRLKKIYNEEQVPLLVLTDYQYVHVTDDTIEIIDTTLRN